MSASLTIPPTTNLRNYFEFLEASDQYHQLQLARAVAEIRELKLDLARLKGESLAVVR